MERQDQEQQRVHDDESHDASVKRAIEDSGIFPQGANYKFIGSPEGARGSVTELTDTEMSEFLDQTLRSE